MRFLTTLFWALVAAVVTLFAWVNWNPVTVNLWANLQADIKLPILLLIVFLCGWLPTWLVMRARVWGHRRRIDSIERQFAASAAPAPTPLDSEPVV